jgi:hypothetical protein
MIAFIRVTQVNIFLPSLKLLRGIVDRMKSMSQHIILSANHEGELHLAIETDNVTVRTVIRELENPSCRMWPSVNECWARLSYARHRGILLGTA